MLVSISVDAPHNANADVSRTLNVQRPATATSKSKLPVVYWIYGGGFEAGSTNTYDATDLITNSITQKEPIVYVAVNYRLSAFGFLAGKELKEAGATNLGLLDQRLGLQWVADNIEAFGGDPSKVTIWGESAGAISVLDQMVLYGGDNQYKGASLFRGAIMNSGSVVPANPVDGTKGQAVYDAVVDAAGCSGKADTLACLRNVSFDKFMAASSALPGIFSYDSLALAYVPRPDGTALPLSPELLVEQGKFAKVPFIVGDLEDEGRLFSQVQPNITTQPEVINYLHNIYFPDVPRSRVAGLVNTYPNLPAAGSPFRTGATNEVHPEYKRLAAILGDITFTITRRVFLTLAQAAAPNLPSYSYLASYLHGTPLLGTFHGSDILVVYGTLPGLPATTFQSYYISFFNHLDPNTSKMASLPTWPLWTKSKNLVNIRQLSNGIIPDNFRSASFKYLSNPANVLRI